VQHREVFSEIFTIQELDNVTDIRSEGYWEHVVW